METPIFEKGLQVKNMSWQECSDQQRIATILRQSIKNDRVAHAYLFAGGRGVGKRRVAMQLGKSLLCLRQDGDSCDQCHHCLRINSGNHPDFHLVEPDGASIKIDQIRGLQKEFSLRAVESKRKVYILDHADKMTVQAANSLLKFLEEPGSEVTAILLTENPHQMLPTILSRCQVMHFAELPFEKRVGLLKSEGLYEPLVRNACQITADLGQARELCQAEWFAQFRNQVLQLNEDVLEKGSHALVGLQEKIVKNDQGTQGISNLLDLYIYWLRDILFFHMDRKQDILNLDQLEAMGRQALRCSKTWLLRAIQIVMGTKDRLARHANPQLTLERMIIELQEV
ncbi:DNA polymerase III subunit delta' [Ammoniphilus resinae]